MKMKLEKSTVFMRDSVTVLAPHSMSAWPFAIASKRVCAVTGTYFTASLSTLSCRSSDATTRRQRSTEKPVTLLLASTKLNGAASVRWAIVMVLVSAIFLRWPSSACAPAADAARAAQSSVQMRSMVGFLLKSRRRAPSPYRS